eukprot:2409028-Amphidinium_carterae.1
MGARSRQVPIHTTIKAPKLQGSTAASVMRFVLDNAVSKRNSTEDAPQITLSISNTCSYSLLRFAKDGNEPFEKSKQISTRKA